MLKFLFSFSLLLLPLTGRAQTSRSPVYVRVFGDTLTRGLDMSHRSLLFWMVRDIKAHTGQSPIRFLTQSEQDGESLLGIFGRHPEGDFSDFYLRNAMDYQVYGERLQDFFSDKPRSQLMIEVLGNIDLSRAILTLEKIIEALGNRNTDVTLTLYPSVSLASRILLKIIDGNPSIQTRLIKRARVHVVTDLKNPIPLGTLLRDRSRLSTYAIDIDSESYGHIRDLLVDHLPLPRGYCEETLKSKIVERVH